MPAPRRILVIEPHADFREILELALDHFGFACDAAPGLDAGLRLLERRAYDLVVSDLLLGTGDRAVAWRRLEALRQAARPTPVGVMSGLAVAEPPADFAFFLLKPFLVEALLRELAIAMPAPAPPRPQIASVYAYLGALEDADWGGLAALCTDDVLYHLPGPDPRHCTTIVGRAAFARFAEDTFHRFREPRFEVLEVRAVGDAVLVDYVGSWRLDDGTRHRLPGSLLLRFRDDAIAEIGVRLDVTTLDAGARRASAPSSA